jgi:hypothetical protein
MFSASSVCARVSCLRAGGEASQHFPCGRGCRYVRIAGENPTERAALSIAALSGAISSIVTTPAELLMIAQQRYVPIAYPLDFNRLSCVVFGQGLLRAERVHCQVYASCAGGRYSQSLFATGKAIISARGVQGLWRGFAATTAREAGWTFGFLGLTPQIRAALQEDSKFCRRNEVAASVSYRFVSRQCATRTFLWLCLTLWGVPFFAYGRRHSRQ